MLRPRNATYNKVGLAPYATSCKSCHSGFSKLLCKLCRNLPPPALGPLITFIAGLSCGPAGWLALPLIKGGNNNIQYL